MQGAYRYFFYCEHEARRLNDIGCNLDKSLSGISFSTISGFFLVEYKRRFFSTSALFIAGQKKIAAFTATARKSLGNYLSSVALLQLDAKPASLKVVRDEIFSLIWIFDV